MIPVFVSYAHEDEKLRSRLDAQLSFLRQMERIQVWHDRSILPGEDWNKEILAQLEKAKIILLLISPDFLASDYCFGKEMQRALERRRHDKTDVFPILLEPCVWEETPLASLNMLPRGGRAISQYANINEPLAEIAREIGEAVKRHEAALGQLAGTAVPASLPEGTLQDPPPGVANDAISIFCRAVFHALKERLPADLALDKSFRHARRLTGGEGRSFLLWNARHAFNRGDYVQDPSLYYGIWFEEDRPGTIHNAWISLTWHREALRRQFGNAGIAPRAHKMLKRLKTALDRAVPSLLLNVGEDEYGNLEVAMPRQLGRLDESDIQQILADVEMFLRKVEPVACSIFTKNPH